MLCSVKTDAISAYPYQIQDVGLDWFTCFAAGRKAGEALYVEGDAILLEAVAQGNDVRCCKVQGFYGIKAGGVFRGTRHDGYLCQLTGSDARDNWERLMPLQTNVTRIDLQTTISFDDPQKKMIVKAYNSACRSPKKKGRRIEYRLETSSAGGDTLYFGKPQSDILGRMYDKGVEGKSDEPGKLVRWEVQLRREVAMKTVLQISECENKPLYITSHVDDHFRKRAISMPHLALIEVEGARVVSRSDNASRLAYLRAVTSKTIARVLESYDLETVLEALGLEEYLRSEDNER